MHVPYLLCLLFALLAQSVCATSIVRDTTRKDQQAQGRDSDVLGQASDLAYTPKGQANKLKKTLRLKKSKSFYGKKQRLHKGKGNFIELDPLMIALAFVLGIGFLLLLWLLVKGITSLSFGLMLLLAIGFALAVFFWGLAKSESVHEIAWYEYFVKFGIFAGVGLLLILGGLIAMFGGMPNMLTFFWIGLILGGIALIFSIIFKKSILNEIFPFWFR